MLEQLPADVQTLLRTGQQKFQQYARLQLSVDALCADKLSNLRRVSGRRRGPCGGKALNQSFSFVDNSRGSK